MQDSLNRYHRISFLEREELSRGLAQGFSLRKIAGLIHRSPSTLSRELRRGNTSTEYRAIKAQLCAIKNMRRRKEGLRKINHFPRLRKFIHSKLRLRWSPEQIARTLQKEYSWDKTMQASHETIYTYLYILPRGELRRELLSYLRQARKIRLKRSKKDRFYAPKITNIISIEERPIEVADRTVPGHWEGDVILGKQRKSYLGTLVERTTRSTLLVPLSSKKAPVVRRAFEKEIRTIPQQLKQTLTYDQGTEMAQHQLFTKHTKMRVYFAHPSSPWERGTNENTNGLIRQFFPKSTDFTIIPYRKIKQVQRLLNERPRKVLQWRTPKEAFTDLLR